MEIEAVDSVNWDVVAPTYLSTDRVPESDAKPLACFLQLVEGCCLSSDPRKVSLSRHTMSPLLLESEEEEVPDEKGWLRLSSSGFYAVLNLSSKGKVRGPNLGNLCGGCEKKKKSFWKRCVDGVVKAGKAVGQGVKKLAHDVKDFLKENKEELLIVAAVVAGAAIVSGVAAAVSGATAKAVTETAVAGLAMAGAVRKKEEGALDNTTDPHDKPSPPETFHPIFSLKDPESDSFRWDASQFLTFPVKNQSTTSSFFDPDGPIKVYNLPLSDPLVYLHPPLEVPAFNNRYIPSLNSKSSMTPHPFVDPDGPVRVHYSPPYEPSKTFDIPGTPLARVAIGGINGIGNSLKDAEENWTHLKSLSGDHQIQWVYNKSHSVPVDVVETAFINFCGFSAPAKFLKENWTKFHEEHLDDPGAKYLQFCHSQGVAHVNNAGASCPQEIRDRVIVIAIAPATIIPKGVFFDVRHYASRLDPVPHAEVAFLGASDDELIREFAQEKLDYLKQSLILLDPHPDASFPDHGWTSPTFREKIQEEVEDFIHTYEPSR